jgi:hypothetical protein
LDPALLGHYWLSEFWDPNKPDNHAISTLLTSPKKAVLPIPEK